MKAFWLGIALLIPGACLTPAAAQQVPRLDIEATCRAAPRLLAEDANPYDGCMQDETEAERELKAMWGSARPVGEKPRSAARPATSIC
jgi:hypothetical protein